MRCRWSCFSKSRGFLLADGCGFGDRRRLGFARVRWSALGFGLRRRRARPSARVALLGRLTSDAEAFSDEADAAVRAAATARACEDATSFADVVVRRLSERLPLPIYFSVAWRRLCCHSWESLRRKRLGYWKLRRERWTLEDFVTRLPRDNVQCMMNRVGRKSVKKRRRSSSDTLVSWVC